MRHKIYSNNIKSLFMDKMNDLMDLLKHEVQDLYSVEEQIIAAMPLMIEKASNLELKKALQNHLKVTQKQLSRLEQVQNMLGIEQDNEEKKGLFSRLFKSKQVCKGMQGIIEEGNKIMKEDMDSDVLDAAIIASAQKIEHYEICGYGTSRTYASELGLTDISQMLETTLNEEYEADDLLTQLAVTRINREAERNVAMKSSGEQAGGQRQGSTQRTKKKEPEMEMASNSRKGATSRTSKTQRGNGAPENKEVTRSASAPGRSSASKKTPVSRVKSGSGSGESKRNESNRGMGGRSASNSSRTR